MWLLLIAAPSVYAEEVNGIVAKDAWDFAKTALTPEEYQSFKEIYGETKEDFEKNKRAEVKPTRM